MEVEKVIYLTNDFVEKTPEGKVLDELFLFKYCCRRHMLTHVDLNNFINKKKIIKLFFIFF